MLRIKPDGSLQIAQGRRSTPAASTRSASPSPAGSSTSRTRALASTRGDTNYTGFTLNPGGHLTPIPGSTYALPNGSKPGDVLFSGDGTRLVGTEIAGSAIDSFTVGKGGLLTKASGSPYSAQTGFSTPQGYGQLGSEFSPTNPDQLYRLGRAHRRRRGRDARPRLELQRRGRRVPEPDQPLAGR